MKNAGKNAQTGEAGVAGLFELLPGQILYDGHDLNLPTGLCVAVLSRLLERFGRVVVHSELHRQSTDVEASDELRGAIKTIRRALQAAGVPCCIEARRRYGYVLVASHVAPR